MPRIAFQKPRKVEWEILTEQYGRLVAEPFEKGYALTVGNSLRRTLLAIVPGAAVSWVKIDGLASGDAKLPGVTERTVDLLLNLKKLAIQVPSGEPRTVRLSVSGPKTITGADVPETDVEIVNPSVHLMTLEAGGQISLELGIELGRGYEAVDPKATSVPAGPLPPPAPPTPLPSVSHHLEGSRLGRNPRFHKPH